MAETLPDFADKRWFACHTKPRCEKKFAALMQAEGFEHYLALVTSVRRYETGTKTHTKPVFPSYVFAQIDPAKKSRIYQHDLLVRALWIENQTLFLRQLEDVKKVVAAGIDVTLHPLLKKGTRVKVMTGPLYGLEGIVDNPASPTGVVIAVDVLQQGLLMKIPMKDLQILH